MNGSRCLLVLVALVLPRASIGQSDFEQPPIEYHTAPVDDAIERLRQAIESDDQQLQWDDKNGWLSSLLEKLDVPVSSQTLVFSKTSLQISRITPQRPRALYFNDDVYVGWVQEGDVVELSAVDPKQGPIFYSIKQNQDAKPVITRDRGQCIVCHASSRTQNVPGYLVRSVFPSINGTPHYGLGTTTTDHSTELSKRYGGWYVTGTHGSMRHLGNAIAKEDSRSPIDVEPGANLTKLDGLIDTSPYLADSSDIVALMVLEHQSQMHNLITRANYEARRAAYQDQIMSKLLDRPEDYVSDSAKRRTKSAGDKLLKYMLFEDELRFTSPIAGTSSFRRNFEQQGIQDSRGRSLRQFDLQTRLFKYPCSFLIHSTSYAGLPVEVREYVENQLALILTGRDESAEFDFLGDQDRKAIREILCDTLPGFQLRIDDVGKQRPHSSVAQASQSL